MCGIAGILELRQGASPDPAVLGRMCEVLAHRGPDDEGMAAAGKMRLGHRRLSVIDIAGGHEPMTNEDGSLWLVYNGEIYNYRQLRDSLAAKGHAFKTETDAEVILHLYEEEREGCLTRLRGMFAFALWDARKETLFLARDRVGIKPLHYAVSDGRLAFSSEIKAILECPWIRREIDYEAMHDYLSLMYVPAPKTIFKGIRKLPAGHYLIRDRDGQRITGYWDIDFSRTVSLAEDELSRELRHQLDDVVGGELVSDVPLGAFLSGGVDSSAVVAIMSAASDRPVSTNAVGFAEEAFDELAYARVVARRFATDHHEYTVEPRALDVLDKLAWFYDEPFGDSSCIPTYYVSEMARKSVKVALSGDGGDETFGGYPRYAYMRSVLQLQSTVPGFVKTFVRKGAGALSPANPWSMKVRNKLGDLYLSPFDLYFKLISIFGDPELALLYREPVRKQLSGYSSKGFMKEVFDRCRSDDPIARCQYLDTKTSLPDEMLVKTDRASAANGLEVRVPLLDHELMEFAATIPSRLKVAGSTGKYIFKKAMADTLPPEVLRRRKMGFSVPLQSWLRTDLRPAVEEELFDTHGIIQELFDGGYVRRLWDYTVHNKMRGFDTTDFATRVWLLFIFSRWHKRFIGQVL